MILQGKDFPGQSPPELLRIYLRMYRQLRKVGKQPEQIERCKRMVLNQIKRIRGNK